MEGIHVNVSAFAHNFYTSVCLLPEKWLPSCWLVVIWLFFSWFLETSSRSWSSFPGVIQASQIFQSKPNSFYLHTSAWGWSDNAWFLLLRSIFKSSVWNASVRLTYTELQKVCSLDRAVARQRNIKLIHVWVSAFIAHQDWAEFDLCASRFERRLTTVTVWKTGWEAFQVWCFIQASGWLKVWLENKTGEE